MKTTLRSSLSSDAPGATPPLAAPGFSPLVTHRVLNSQFRHILHAYHNECPWNPSMSHILYTAFDSVDGPGFVVIQELASGEETVLARTELFNCHTGAWTCWALDGRTVVFGTAVDGRPCPALARIDSPGKPIILKQLAGYHLRSLSTDRRYLYAHDGGHGPAPGDASAVKIDLEKGGKNPLCAVGDVLKVLPERLRFHAVGYFLNHTVPNADGTRVYFKLMMRLPDGGQKFNSFWVLNTENRKLHCHGDRISGHPAWLPDGRHILNIKHPMDGSDNRWIVRVDCDTAEDERFLDFPIEGPGHPAVSPDGRSVATDAFTSDGLVSPVYLIDTASRSGREIIRLNHRFEGKTNPRAANDMRRIARGQPHPAFSPDGNSLAVNWNGAGQRMRLVILEASHFYRMKP